MIKCTFEIFEPMDEEIEVTVKDYLGNTTTVKTTVAKHEEIYELPIKDLFTYTAFKESFNLCDKMIIEFKDEKLEVECPDVEDWEFLQHINNLLFSREMIINGKN